MPRSSALRLADAAPVFAALGDPARLRIVARLCENGPLSVARLAADASITRQAVSKHLANLSGAGLVTGTRSGREHVWQLQPRRLEHVRECLARISGQWDDAIERLRAALAQAPD